MPKSQNNKKGAGRRRKNKGLLPLVAAPPASMRALLTYSTAQILPESAAGLGGSYFYRLNSVYDPDSSGVGASATGYTTWSGVYLNYRVRRVTVRVEGVASGGTAATAMADVVIAPVAAQAVVPSNAYLWKTIPYAKHMVIAPVQQGGNNKATLTATFDMPVISHVTKKQFDSDFDFSGQVGSNPNRQLYLLVGVQGLGVTSVMSLTYNVNLTYEVEWFNPVPLQ